MFGQDILCGISKVPFEIPHKISFPYIERFLFYLFRDENVPSVQEFTNIFEMIPSWHNNGRHE